MAKGYQPRAWKTAPCTGCGADVKITKPSRTGMHYCSAPDCQRAKSRAYQQDRSRRAGNIDKNNILILIHALALRARQQCPRCGLVDALPGYKHPDPDGFACAAIGETPMGSMAQDIVEAVWPTGRREYVEVES